MAEQVGEFVYKKKDLIGHGAFAVVFKGHHKKVNFSLSVWGEQSKILHCLMLVFINNTGYHKLH